MKFNITELVTDRTNIRQNTTDGLTIAYTTESDNYAESLSKEINIKFCE